MEQNKHLESLRNFEQSLEINEILEDKKSISINLLNIGDVYFYLADYPKALEYFKKSIIIKEEIGDKRGIVLAYYGIGKLYLKIRQYNKALDYTNNSLKMANNLKILKEQKDIHKQLSEIYAATKNYKKAYENHLFFKELNDSIFNEENIKKITSLEFQYKYEKEKQISELE